MIAQVLTPDEMTNEDLKSFRDQGISVDDWDYVVLAPIESLIENESTNYDGTPTTVLGQREYVFERIMVGGCSNYWYRATYRGKLYAIGVAYHA